MESIENVTKFADSHFPKMKKIQVINNLYQLKKTLPMVIYLWCFIPIQSY